jgi:integrase
MSNDAKKFEGLEVFETYLRNKHTRKLYRGSFERFLRYAEIDDPIYFLTMPDEDLYEFLKRYLLHLRQRTENGTLKANSIRIELSGIVHFFTYNDRIVNWKKLYKIIPDNVKCGGDKAYTKDQIRILLKGTNKIRNRFLILIMATAGARVGAIPELKLKHVKSIENCYRIILYNEDRQEYVSFMTPECSRLYEQYLEVRKSEGEVLTLESPLIRYDYSDQKTQTLAIGSSAIYDIVSRIMKKSGIERVKNGHRYDIPMDHGFRKFFGTCLKINSQLSYSVTERLMGHTKYLDKSYFLPENTDLFEEYKKAIPGLTMDDIEAKNAEIKTLQEQLEQKHQLQDQIARLEQIQSNVLAELEHLKTLNANAVIQS